MLQSLATEKQKQDLIKAIQEKDTVKELEDFLSSEVKSRALGLLWESTKEIVGRLRGKEWRNIILDPCPPPNRPQKRFTLTLEINPELDEAAKTQLIDVLNGKETNLNAIRIPVTISVNAVIQW